MDNNPSKLISTIHACMDIDGNRSVLAYLGPFLLVFPISFIFEACDF